METIEFIRLVDAMRQAQNEYFRTRTYSALVKAKELEKKVDRLLPQMKRQESEKMPTQLMLSLD